MDKNNRDLIEKLGKAIGDSRETLERKKDLLEIYGIDEELEMAPKNSFSEGQRNLDPLIFGENLRSYVKASLNYYEALLENYSLLNLFKSVNGLEDCEERDNILFGDLEKELGRMRKFLHTKFVGGVLYEISKDFKSG